MSVIVKADVPDDPSQWDKGTIIECIGTPDEHEDVFYRSGNWGIEEHDDGEYQIYAIVDEEPIMVRDQMKSFEECIAFIRENGEKKALGDEAPAEDAEEGEADEAPLEESPVEEETEEEEAPAEEESENPFVAEDDEAPAEDEEEESEEEEAPAEDEEEEDDESEKTEKSFRSMMQARDMRKSYARPAGMMNRNCNALRKTSSNEGGVGQYIRKSTEGYKYRVIDTGTDKDYCGMGEEVKSAEENADGASKKKVDASVAGLKKSSDRMSIREMIAFKKSGGSFAKMPTVQTKIDSNPEFGDGNAWEMKSQAMNTIRDEPGTVASDFAEGDIDNADSGIMMDATPVGPADGVQTSKPITEQPGAQTGDTAPTAVDQAMTQEAKNPELVDDGELPDLTAEPAPEIDSLPGEVSEGNPADIDTLKEKVNNNPEYGGEIPEGGVPGAGMNSDITDMDEGAVDMGDATEDPLATDDTEEDDDTGVDDVNPDDYYGGKPYDAYQTFKSAQKPSELPMRELMEFKKSGMDFESYKMMKWATPVEGSDAVQTNLDDWGKVGDANAKAKQASKEYDDAKKRTDSAWGADDSLHSDASKQARRDAQRKEDRARDKSNSADAKKKKAEFEATHAKPQ